MDWTTPKFQEIKMDAEIGSYQEERDRTPEPIVRPGPARADPVHSLAA